jgi:hypothetical protein
MRIGWVVFLDTNLIFWSSKRQNVVSHSSAEYRAMANGVAMACWLRQLLQEFHVSLTKSIIIYCDNVSAVYLSTNPIQHRCMKHVEIDFHVLHVPTTSQFTDIFTKGLFTSMFSEFRSSLNIRNG